MAGEAQRLLFLDDGDDFAILAVRGDRQSGRCIAVRVDALARVGPSVID